MLHGRAANTSDSHETKSPRNRRIYRVGHDLRAAGTARYLLQIAPDSLAAGVANMEMDCNRARLLHAPSADTL